ncbi:MAG: cytochrome c [Geminicoccaceae bacterium]|nr:cytochrome c [Geminicoccaceae bacterium]MCX7630856.1 cytochrome c [Geminicoccaceae bacterium]MDW8369084.1 hypothetical protein [Geminicoccaceae bacterium]
MIRIGAWLLLLPLVLGACSVAPVPTPAEPDRQASLPVADDSEPDPALGRTIAATVCGHCHALAGEGPSPHPAAPPFPRLARRISGEALMPLLEEGIRANHPDMPDVRLAPAEIDSFLAFWSSL